MWILKKGCKWWFWVLIGQPSGLLWSPSLSGGGGGSGDSGLWSEPTGSGNSLCRNMFVCEVYSSGTSAAPAGPQLSQCAGSPRLPRLTRPLNFRQEFSPNFLIGTCMQWVRGGGCVGCPLLHSVSLLTRWIGPVESLRTEAVRVERTLNATMLH